MNKLYKKNKIAFQTNENIWNNQSILTSKKKKWSFFLKNVNNSNKLKPKNLKDLYKRRLLAKQKFKKFYGCMADYQLKNLFLLFKQKEQPMNQITIFLEQRLDIILYRMGFVSSIFEGKQLIFYKNVYINDVLIKSSNYQLSEGDVIYVDNYKTHTKNIPIYLEYNKKLKKVIFLRKPEISEIEYPFSAELNLVAESFL